MNKIKAQREEREKEGPPPALPRLMSNSTSRLYRSSPGRRRFTLAELSKRLHAGNQARGDGYLDSSSLEREAPKYLKARLAIASQQHHVV